MKVRSPSEWKPLSEIIRRCFPLVENNYCRPKKIDNYGLRLERLRTFAR
jgi:hypothetical protein